MIVKHFVDSTLKFNIIDTQKHRIFLNRILRGVNQMINPEERRPGKIPSHVQKHLIPDYQGDVVYECIACEETFSIDQFLYTCHSIHFTPLIGLHIKKI